MWLKSKPVRSERLRRSARGYPCTARIPGVCTGDSETTVLAHPPLANGGMATKGSDVLGAVICHACHQCIDGQAHRSVPREVRYECWIRAHQETLDMWVSQGLIAIKGAA